MTTRKRCEKCGKTSTVKPRERRCKKIEPDAIGSGVHYCWGKLVSEPRSTVRQRPLMPAGSYEIPIPIGMLARCVRCGTEKPFDGPCSRSVKNDIGEWRSCDGYFIPVDLRSRAERSRRPQDVAAVKLKHAERKVDQKQREIVALAKSIARASSALRRLVTSLAVIENTTAIY